MDLSPRFNMKGKRAICSPTLLLVCGVLIIYTLSRYSSSSSSSAPAQSWAPRATGPPKPIKASEAYSEIGRARNSTLGFEKIIVIGLEERSDRKDALVLQSSLTGFNVEFLDGVRGEDVPDKALPPNMIRGQIRREAYVGSWRGHMNAIRSVLENGLSSALIMEDDVDWDIRLLDQMEQFARGVRYITDVPEDQPQHSPWGDEVDLVWAGHCGEVLPESDNRMYVIKDDETVAPKAHQPWLKALRDYPEKTRIVHAAGAPICTFAYAVSARGAQKILWALGMHGSDLPFDNRLAFMCRDKVMDIKCVSVQPMLFFHHRPAGQLGKDSDIEATNPDKIREKGFTENIVWSARLNIEQMIMGTKDYVMQW